MQMEKHLSFEDMESFIEGKLSGEQLSLAEVHFTKCKVCLKKVESLRAISSGLERWTARSHGEAYARKNKKEREDVITNVSNNLQLTELDFKRLQKKEARERHEEWVGGEDTDESSGEGFRLAAAPAEEGNTGEAWGVAVDETGKGSLVKIIAWVGTGRKEQGSLHVVATEVEGVKQAGKTYVVTPPSKALEELLSQRFKTIASLSALELHKRDVHVEIKNPKFLDQGESLLLSVIVAIVKAAVDGTVHEDLVYSSHVSVDGKLEGVGRIEEKAAHVSKAGDYQLVVSPGDYDKVRSLKDDHRPPEIKSFSTLDELIAFFDLAPTISATPGAARNGREAGMKKPSVLVRILTIPASALLVCCIALLWYMAGNFFVMTDLMITWYLGHEGSNIFRYAKLMEYTVGIVILLWLSAFIKFKGIRRYKIEQVLTLAVLLYAIVNLTVFLRCLYVLPTNFDKYERMEYLRYNETFKPFTEEVPNYRYEQFKHLTASLKAADHTEAIKVGLKIRVRDPMFKNTFIVMARLLMDQVNNSEYARRALRNYVDYENYILNRKNARECIADTIDWARDLLNRYGLQDSFYGNVKLGGFVEETLIRYELKR